jgi:hypothetical protein
MGGDSPLLASGERGRLCGFGLGLGGRRDTGAYFRLTAFA